MKKLIAIALLALAGCSGLQERTPQEHTAIHLMSGGQAISYIQNRAKTLYDATPQALGPYAYRTIIQATSDLNGLLARINTANALAENGVITVECAEIDLVGSVTTACSREDITNILVKIQAALEKEGE